MITEVRKKDRTTPIIMVSTEGEKERVVNAIRAGVTNYVVKPFTADVLLSKVQQTLAKAKAA